MRSFIALIIALATLFAVPVHAQTHGRVVVQEITIVEEWDPALQTWVEVTGAERLVQSRGRSAAPAIAVYGPFRVTGPGSVSMIGATDRGSPALFAQMLRDFPDLKTVKLIDVAGTRNDIANMAVGRMIRDAGLAIHVPAHGSVRSGGVELLLAGARQQIDDGARFAVHSWRDSLGKQASDYAADHQVHRLYLGYYAAMGMSAADARAFYEMTNSAAHEGAMWLDAEAMRRWSPVSTPMAQPVLEYATFGGESIGAIAMTAPTAETLPTPDASALSMLDSQVTLP